MKARRRQEYREQIYRNYVSEGIRNISENVARGIGREGVTYIGKTYAEILYPPKETDRSADDVIDEIKQKLREYE